MGLPFLGDFFFGVVLFKTRENQVSTVTSEASLLERWMG